MPPRHMDSEMLSELVFVETTPMFKSFGEIGQVAPLNVKLRFTLVAQGICALWLKALELSENHDLRNSIRDT